MEKKRKEEKRRKDEDLFKVVDSTIDPRTYLVLEKIASKLKIDTYLGAISSGKEAKIYPAKTIDGKFYAVKIYYVSTASHKRAVEKYTLGDKRFEKIKVSNTRQLIFTWAKKEFKNLKRMYEAGVWVPEPILVMENVLVMQFIGDNGVRAPLLKELPDDEIDQDLYDQVVSQIQLMVNKAKLVHGDLSEYNVMVYDHIYIIDVSQSLPVDHENARELLLRDITRVNEFFSSKGVKVLDIEEILKKLEIP
ncbi:MAG: non-specific serine/threonine protein kinase [Candidatus Aramenus sulfurataquae]|uniref:non-specific serine/threonine protein kinase n=2 Tax=Candidatus Aramenus sulfurataquae TaxID=1326980 RepID=W7KMU5_9CREN|nr:MAG: non-specific serine/threonine protein kinase [Candidatus Aramenus sulfurataquae]MCL7343799.1 serine protein kinase RIO [Candidatus Aramenus sulfurataquae]